MKDTQSFDGKKNEGVCFGGFTTSAWASNE